MTDDPNLFLPDKIQHYETFVNEVLKSKLKYFKATVEKCQTYLLMVLLFLW